MTTVALFGAGGKMGVRLATNLAKSDYETLHVEVSPQGQARLKEETGLDCIDQAEALDRADVVILAVPDRLIGKVLSGFVADLKPGTAVIMLDAAAPYAGTLPERSDVTYFVAHPCHPPLFNDETDPRLPARHVAPGGSNRLRIDRQHGLHGELDKGFPVPDRLWLHKGGGDRTDEGNCLGLRFERHSLQCRLSGDRGHALASRPH